jgi:hypothetical protein
VQHRAIFVKIYIYVIYMENTLAKKKFAEVNGIVSDLKVFHLEGREGEKEGKHVSILILWMTFPPSPHYWRWNPWPCTS